MNARSGERLGWTGGWFGGFLWVLIIAIVRIGQGDISGGLVGIGLFLAAAILIWLLAPWKFPKEYV